LIALMATTLSVAPFLLRQCKGKTRNSKREVYADGPL
jgi:hypothetical protein